LNKLVDNKIDCSNETKLLEIGNKCREKFLSDKDSLNEYLQYMVGLAKIKQSDELLEFIKSSLEDGNSKDDLYFIASFLWHCNLEGKGKTIPFTERKALGTRFEKIMIKISNNSLSSAEAKKELSVMRSTVNCMLFYCK
jgi:hypothetical protein